MGVSSCYVNAFPFTISLNSQKLISFTLSQRRELFASISATNSPSAATISLLKSKHLPPDFTQKQLLDTLRQEKDEASALNLFKWALEQPEIEPSRQICEEILRKLGKAGSFDAMRRVLDDMKNSRVEIGEGAFFILIESYAKFELYGEAIGVLDVMEQEFDVKPGTFSYNLLLNILVDGNKLKLVEDVHSRMLSEGLKPDVSTFNILIKALCKAHQIRAAILMIEDMPRHGLSPDEKTFNTLMHCYIEGGDLEGALRIRDQMVAANCPPTSITVNTLIHGFCKQGKIEEIFSFVQEMSSQGFSPDSFTFNTLVNGLCKAGHISHAIDVLDLMLQEGFDPDLVTYNTLISGLCEAGEVEEAIKVLTQMIFRSYLPDRVTYNILISTLCKKNQVQEATELTRVLASKGVLPDVCTLNSLIKGHCLNSNFSSAMELFQEMKTEGCQPDEFTYNILIDYLCAKKKLDEAMSLAYNPIILALFRRKRTKEAMRLFREMEEKADPPDYVSYKIVFQGLCSGGGSIDEAVNFAVEMMGNGYVPEFSSFYNLAEGLFALAREETLVKLIDMIMKKAYFSDNEVDMIKGFLKIRKFQDALATLGRVLNSRYPKRNYR
nr:pentatricopeptide repeat-containing protein At3g53700, chloroplastic-like [Ipomoea trifida]